MAKVAIWSRREKRHRRTSKGIRGTVSRPRLSVFRSNKNLYVQVIDDSRGVTLLAFSSRDLPEGSKTEKSFKLGKKLASDLVSRKILRVVFDRGSNLFHGRVKSFVEGVREGGLPV